MRRMNITAVAMTAVMALTGGSLTGCVGEAKKDKPKAAAKAPKNFVVDGLPANAKKVNIEFEDKATLLGYELDNKKGTLKGGDKVSYTLYWKLNKPLDKDWNLFTHVYDSRKKRLMNIDKVGDLRQSGPKPEKWEVGKIYSDKQTLTIPKGVQGNKLEIVAGFWKEKESLKVTKGSKFRDTANALALAIPLKPGAADAPAFKPPTLRVDRLDKNARILVDGKLNEAAWANAPSTGAFVNVGTGKEDPNHPVQGSAKVLWDDKNLYVAFEVKDKDIVGGFNKTDVDPHLWTKDTVEIMIDPDGNGDNKDYYEIQVNPQNLVFDSHFDGYNQPKGGPEGPFGNQDWQSKLKSAVVIEGTLDKSDDEDKGYTVEIAIPWTAFHKAKTSPPAVGDTWRINFYAMQNNSGVAWSPILGKGNFHKASQFGKVLFAEKGWEPASAAPAASGVAAAAASGPTSVTAALSTGAPAPAGSAAPAASAAAPKLNPNAPAPAAPKPAVPAATQTP